MPEITPITDVSPRHLSAVRLWLYAVAGIIFLTMAVGGATRLTESGLSITEWKPVTGVLPPLSQADWQAEFQKYQAIPQYREVNRGMSLDAFKTIYYWEWSHRVLARATGLHWATMVLGTSHGGIAEMTITAKVLQLGVPVVTAFQVCRLVAVLVLTGPLYAWLHRRRASSGK